VSVRRCSRGFSASPGFRVLIAGYVSDAGLGYLQLMLVIVIIYILLGMVMEPFGALLITLPVLLPVLHAEQISLVWFGVLVVKLLEIGMITPPVGLNVFVIRNVAQKYASVVQIFAGVIPFLLADLVVVALVVLFPGIVMFLPDLF
jgi:TRAP-type C4-dicarboxylate transport system permease large subunit